MDKYKLKRVIRDGKKIWTLECPKCKIFGSIDDDQFNGRISTLCNCGFHKTVNFSKEISNG